MTGEGSSTNPTDHHRVVTNRAVNDGECYRDGISITTDTAFTTNARPTVEVYIAGGNNAGALLEPGAMSIGAYHMGTGLTTPNVLAIYNALQKCMAVLGREQRTAYFGDSRISINTTAAALFSATLPNHVSVNNGVGGENPTEIYDRVVADPYRAQWNVVLCSGRNGFTPGLDVAGYRATIAATIALLGHTRYRVLEVFPNSIAGEITGATDRLALDQLNAYLLADYGAKFIPLLTYLQAAGDGSGNDNSDIANGWVPRSLMKPADTTHQNALGDVVIKDRLVASLTGGVWP
jgi:hypothetical protein